MVALAIVSLLWVAIYNGYPLVWYDSGAYLSISFLLEMPPSRPPFYGLFLLATHWRLTLWTSVAAQGALVVYVIKAILDDEEGGGVGNTRRDGALLAICICLAIGTALPWFAGQVMADVFTGIAVLSLYGIVQPRSRRPVRAGLAALLIGSLTVHFEHLPLIVAIAVVLQLAAWTGQVRLRAGGLRIAWLCIAAAVVVLSATTWLRTGRAFDAGPSHVFVLARLFDDGSAQRLLAEHCGDRDYRLCAHRGELPQSFDEALWGTKSPFRHLGGWQESEAESWRMIRDAAAEYPWRILRTTLRAALSQLQRFQTAADLTALPEDNATNGILRRLFPHEYESYRRARQQSGELPRAGFGRLHWWVGVASAGLSLSLLAAGIWRGRPETVQLHAMVWVALIVNALIVAAANTPADRFGARVAWLVPLSVLLSLARYVNTRPSSGSS